MRLCFKKEILKVYGLPAYTSMGIPMDNLIKSCNTDVPMLETRSSHAEEMPFTGLSKGQIIQETPFLLLPSLFLLSALDPKAKVCPLPVSLSTGPNICGVAFRKMPMLRLCPGIFNVIALGEEPGRGWFKHNP